MKILVTGAGGFVGSAVMRALQDKHDVVGLVRAAVAGRGDLIVANLASDASIAAIEGPFDCLVNCAYDFENHAANEAITDNVIWLCSLAKIRKFIHMSSVAVYDLESCQHIDETSRSAKFLDPYTATKIACDVKIRNAVELRNVHTLILQPSIIFGTGSLWSQLARRACHAKRVTLPRAGGGACNYVYIEDLVQAITLAVQLPPEKFEMPQCNRFIITGPEVSTWRRFYESHNDISTDSLDLALDFKDRRFSDKLTLNMMFHVMYSKIMWKAFCVVLTKIKRHRRKNNSAHPNVSHVYKPVGMSRYVQAATVTYSHERATRALGYQPLWTLERGIAQMSNSLEHANAS